MNPETLRELFDTWKSNPAWTLADVAFHVNAAADAWELQRYDLAKSKEEIEHLLKRLEEAGKYHSAAEACMELESDLAAR